MQSTRKITLGLIGAAFIAYFVLFGVVLRGGFAGILFFLPFTMIPFIINAVLVYRWRSEAGQTLILFTTLAYAGWFAYIYIDATQFHPDPQSPLAFLFVGLFAAPVLLLVWITGWVVERKFR